MRGVVPQILVAGMELSVDVLLNSWLQGAGVVSWGSLLFHLSGWTFSLRYERLGVFWRDFNACGAGGVGLPKLPLTC